MSEAVLSRISNLIRDESDLKKIDELRRQFRKEKTSIDLKLSTATGEQGTICIYDKIEFIFEPVETVINIDFIIKMIDTFVEKVFNVLFEF